MLFGLESTMTAMAEDAKRGITDRFRSLPISQRLGGTRPRARRPRELVGPEPRRAHGRRPPHRLAPDDGPRRDRTRRRAAALAAVRPALARHLPRPALPRPGATTAVQVLVWPIGFLSTVFVSAETMPGWLGAIAEWNPVSATATAARELFGNPTGATSGWLAENAVLAASVWPLVITAGVPAARGVGLPAPAALEPGRGACPRRGDAGTRTGSAAPARAADDRDTLRGQHRAS